MFPVCQCWSYLKWRLPYIAYAVYFDHKRQTDPEFRRHLKRQNRRQDRLAREEKESRGKEQEAAIRQAVKEAQSEGFPTDMDDKEHYFMSEVAVGESMCAEGSFIVNFK